MNLAAKPMFEQQNLQGIDDVLLALEKLGHNLPRTDLHLLNYFNQTYLIITRNVRQQLRKGEFEHPAFLEQFDRRFAYYYFDALRRQLEGSKPPPAWLVAFQSARRGDASPFIGMALGVNAHVNNDIPQVLRDCHATHKHRRDYNKVNGIIYKSLEEVLGQFNDQDNMLRPQRRLLKPAYLFTMKWLIRLWRGQAWRKAKRLEQRAIAVSAIEHRAERLTHTLNRLPL